MLKYLSSNLNMLMAKARLSSSELARQLHIPATTIKRIRNNEQANPTLTTLIPIARYFSITLDELIGNESCITLDEAYSYKKTHIVPLLSWQECIHYASLDYAQFKKHVITERNTSQKAFALVVDDPDLVLFPEKSILLVEPQRNPETGDYVIVANLEQTIASVRKYIIEIDQIYLKPLVAGVGISILTSEYQIVGVIIQSKMELK